MQDRYITREFTTRTGPCSRSTVPNKTTMEFDLEKTFDCYTAVLDGLEVSSAEYRDILHRFMNYRNNK